MPATAQQQKKLLPLLQQHEFRMALKLAGINLGIFGLRVVST